MVLKMCYCTCYHFHCIMKIEDFDFDNILLDEKVYESILIYEVSNKTLVQNFCVLYSIKLMGLLEITMEISN